MHPPAVARDLLWRADASQDYELEWASYSAASTARFSRVTAPVPPGKSTAWRVDLIDGDVAYGSDGNGPWGERAELGMSNPRSGLTAVYKPRPEQFAIDRLWGVGDERWIAMQIRLGTGYNTSPGSWNSAVQLKQEGSLGTPIIALHVQGGQWQLYRGVPEDSDTGTFVWSTPATVDVWAKFVFYVKFSPDPAVGRLGLYGNVAGGATAELYPVTPGATMKAGSPYSHLRIGTYRDPLIVGDSTVYYAGICCAKTRAMAEAVAF